MVDQFLGGLFGSKSDDDEPTRRKRANDYVDRYDRGAYDQMGNDEVLHNYRAATSQLSPDEYQAAATDAMRNMSPEQRRELRRELKHRSNDRFNAKDDSPEEVAAPCSRPTRTKGVAGWRGSSVSVVQSGSGSQSQGSQSQGGQSQGGGIGGVLDNPVAKVAMAGVAAMVAKKLTDPNR